MQERGRKRAQERGSESWRERSCMRNGGERKKRRDGMHEQHVLHQGQLVYNEFVSS